MLISCLLISVFFFAEQGGNFGKSLWLHPGVACVQPAYGGQPERERETGTAGWGAAAAERGAEAWQNGTAHAAGTEWHFAVHRPCFSRHPQRAGNPVVTPCSPDAPFFTSSWCFFYILFPYSASEISKHQFDLWQNNIITENNDFLLIILLVRILKKYLLPMNLNQNCFP